MTTNKGWANSQKEMRGDQVLLELTGLATGTRGQFVRGVWQYIKANNLQERYDGRMIVPDETMAMLMGTQGQPINAFTMLRHIERHLQRIEDVNELGSVFQKERNSFDHVEHIKEENIELEESGNF